MSFLRNAWYCAGFTSDVAGENLYAITMLGEPLVLFRGADGKVTALADRCPHRFAPLSMGKVCEGQVQCPYHGLRFDAQGGCSHNPHGDGSIPKAAQVRAYPATEKHGAVWVWMGDPSRATAAALPDFSAIDERPGWTRVQGRLTVQANYQLVIDNLLDLTHAPYLHPFLASAEPPPPDFRPDIRMEQEGDSVLAINEFHRMPTTPLYRMLWERGEPPQHSTLRANMRWDAPSVLLLDTGASPSGAPREDGPSAPSAHWLTPESDTSTHYFWAAARDRYVGNAEVSAQMAGGIDAAFRQEDEPMIEACQRRMGGTDLISLKPVLLVTDGPAMRARRILSQRIEAEGV